MKLIFLKYILYFILIYGQNGQKHQNHKFSNHFEKQLNDNFNICHLPHLAL